MTASMVFGAAFLQDVLYPAGRAPLGRERLAREMITTILHGTLDREVMEYGELPHAGPA